MEVRQNWMDRMGPQWESGMDAELQALGQLIDYLKAHQAGVAAVYFPQPTWESTFAPALRFRERIMPLMAAKAVPVVDLIHQFPDSFFVDSVHLNYQGSVAIQPFLIELARQHFEKHRRQ